MPPTTAHLNGFINLEPGTTEEQIRLVDEHLGAREWGICTECGMGRVEREDVPAMLDAHREIPERAAPVA
jgi:hypothetical protein